MTLAQLLVGNGQMLHACLSYEFDLPGASFAGFGGL
jgi:hypothetical protein